MRHRSSEQAVQYCDQKNAVLFWFQSIKRILAYAFHSTWSIALIAFVASRILVRYAPAYIPMIWSAGLLLVLSLIAWKIIHIILLRKAQFYSITAKRIISRGGFFVTYHNEIRGRDIRSIRYTQLLLQRFFNAGTVIISSSASHNDMIVLADINAPQKFLQLVNEIRQ